MPCFASCRRFDNIIFDRSIDTYVCSHRPSIPNTVYSLSETLEASAFLKGIKEEAALSKIWVSVGLHEIPESSGDQDGEKKRCYNSQCLVSPEGELASVYRKLHLFDVDFKGSMTISESGTTLKGDVLPDVTNSAVGKSEHLVSSRREILIMPDKSTSQSECLPATIFVSRKSRSYCERRVPTSSRTHLLLL